MATGDLRPGSIYATTLPNGRLVRFHPRQSDDTRGYIKLDGRSYKGFNIDGKFTPEADFVKYFCGDAFYAMVYIIDWYYKVINYFAEQGEYEIFELDSTILKFFDRRVEVRYRQAEKQVYIDGVPWNGTIVPNSVTAW